MIKTAIFVDGSNLFGSLRSMSLEVDDYEKLYSHLFDEAKKSWKKITKSDIYNLCMGRIYWYVVGSIDEWDLTLPQSQASLRKSYDGSDVHDAWLAKTGKAYHAVHGNQLQGKQLQEKAWQECFADFKKWYDSKKSSLHSIRKFHQAVRANTDLIDIIECGHWKVNFINKYVEEKGLDTKLAVDMVAFENIYDIALVISGDADSIPSICHCKAAGKYVGAVEFINGSPPEHKGRAFSSRLKEHADFVVRVYESELLRLNIAKRSTK